MARGYLSSGQWIADRENSSRNVRIRRNYSSLNDQCLAEKATRAEKKSEYFSNKELIAPRNYKRHCALIARKRELCINLAVPGGRAAFFLVYAFPSAANSRNRRAANQIALGPPPCSAFWQRAVFTITIPSSTAYDA
jgi:hypothetical protein